MKNIKMILFAATVALAASGCSSTFYSASSNAYDDLYAIHDRQAIAERQKAEAEARRAEAEARRAEAEAQQAEWRAQLAELGVELAQNNTRTDSDGVIIVDGDSYSSGNVYDSFLADSYESAYARRLRGFKSLTYNMPSSYFDLRYGNSRFYVSAYDPSFYNVMVSGSQVWVEPKYITSMFGTWGATNATMLIHSPWYYGWSAGFYDPFYYSSWGFPHYSWYDWNWNICYGGWGTNLWWGWGGVYRPWRPYYGFHYGPHHHHIGGLHMPPRWDMSGGGGYWYRGGNYYGSRGQAGSRVDGSRGPVRGSSIVNRGSAHSTPYRSPNSGNTYGQGTRGQQGSAVAPSQGNNAGRSQGSIGRNNSTRRQSTVTPQRQNNNYNYNQNQNSNRQNFNQNQNFGSSTNRGSSFSSGSMGGGSRGGGAMGGGGGSRSSGSRGR
ncbi:MAG: hypothetical protein J6C60_03395 [Alistipes sp.]|nr:hypothetical protein [Alistipes sp.]MBP3474534.1 hypothetical protein [Alistipes sp.]